MRLSDEKSPRRSFKINSMLILCSVFRCVKFGLLFFVFSRREAFKQDARPGKLRDFDKSQNTVQMNLSIGKSALIAVIAFEARAIADE